MTVDELIKKLTALPGNMEVVVVDNEGNVQDVTEVFAAIRRRK